MPARRRVQALNAAAFAGALAVAWVTLPAHGALTDEPLEPERAFRLSARLAKAPNAAPGRIDLHFRIEDGYYLYRDRFKVAAPGLATGVLAVPAGMEKNDPFVGRSRILKKSATLRLPLTAKTPPGEYVLNVTAQGCAEERVCYAPFTQAVRVSVP